ncbi:DUF885 family protein [Caulobacter sp. S45]|uniref:DUF885 domain-containing protein n=1 Tax=Caulobacter sp. S45 TaxID=1641861 RepID=UPI00131C4D51|nr:DUF885 family protein [Caulobacter sp. S45]
MLDRRQLLASAVAAGVAAPVHAATHATGADQGQKLTALLDTFWAEELQRDPERATDLGLDTGANAPLKHRLKDVSRVGIEGDRADVARQAQGLAAIDRKALTGMDAVNYDTVAYMVESRRRVLALDMGGTDGFSPSCYVLSPITGAYHGVPDFLENKHKVEDAEGAEAYLDRMKALAGALDDNTERFRHDTAKGVVPPDFLIDITLTQMGQIRVPASQSRVVASLAKRAADKGLPARYAEGAAHLHETMILPALDRQMTTVKAARAQAGHVPGISRFRDGEAFYAANLRYTTTTSMTPKEVHQLGLDEAKEIGARLDVLLKAQGLTQGSLGQRVQALFKDPTQFYANTPEGKAQLLAYLQAKLEAVKARLPTVFDRLPPYKVEARAIPAAIDSGAPGAYSEPPSLDGSRPGYIRFNLHDTAEWPRWNLDTTLYHEGLPGHQLQMGLSLQSTEIPILRRNMYLSAYGEGWALYAEQLANEIGMYDDSPLGRIGWLKGQMFRAGRCIVDTGMHTMGWSQEKAVQTLGDLTGDAVGFTTREVNRYCAIPAQACSYKIGHTYWEGQRARAKAALGAKFDIKAFHDAGLLSGAMPLEVLGRRVDDYISTVKS